MTRSATMLLVATALLSLSGCLAKTAVDVVTAPVRVASKTVDWATTSQSEADEKRGRALRKREERAGKIQRSYEKHRRQCQDGDQTACATARTEYDQIQTILSGLPGDPR